MYRRFYLDAEKFEKQSQRLLECEKMKRTAEYSDPEWESPCAASNEAIPFSIDPRSELIVQKPTLCHHFRKAYKNFNCDSDTKKVEAWINEAP